MKRCLALLLSALVLIGTQAGCGGNKDKGINRDKDKPKPSAEADLGMPLFVVPPSGGSTATA
jgi:hypothetical protein